MESPSLVSRKDSFKKCINRKRIPLLFTISDKDKGELSNLIAHIENCDQCKPLYKEYADFEKQIDSLIPTKKLKTSEKEIFFKRVDFALTTLNSLKVPTKGFFDMDFLNEVKNDLKDVIEQKRFIIICSLIMIFSAIFFN